MYATFPALPIGFSRKGQSHHKTVTSSNATKSFREKGLLKIKSVERFRLKFKFAGHYVPRFVSRRPDYSQKG